MSFPCILDVIKNQKSEGRECGWSSTSPTHSCTQTVEGLPEESSDILPHGFLVKQEQDEQAVEK